MKKEITRYVDCFSNHFVIDGKHYVLGKTIDKKIGKVVHKDKIVLEEVDPTKEEAVLTEQDATVCR